MAHATLELAIFGDGMDTGVTDPGDLTADVAGVDPKWILNVHYGVVSCSRPRSVGMSLGTGYLINWRDPQQEKIVDERMGMVLLFVCQ